MPAAIGFRPTGDFELRALLVVKFDLAFRARQRAAVRARCRAVPLSRMPGALDRRNGSALQAIGRDPVVLNGQRAVGEAGSPRYYVVGFAAEEPAEEVCEVDGVVYETAATGFDRIDVPALIGCTGRVLDEVGWN